MNGSTAQAPPREASLSKRRLLLDEWVERERRIAQLQAEQAALLSQRLDLLSEEPDFDRGGDVSLRSLAAEYGAAAHIPPSTAATRLTDAWALAHRFPEVLESMRAGRISKQHADVILTEAPLLTDDDSANREEIHREYARQVLAFAEHDTAARTRVHARGVAAAVAPAETVEAHRRARARRFVKVAPEGDGMATLTALLPEILANAIKDRLTAQAKALQSLNAAHDEAVTPPAEPVGVSDEPDERYAEFLESIGVGPDDAPTPGACDGSAFWDASPTGLDSGSRSGSADAAAVPPWEADPQLGPADAHRKSASAAVAEGDRDAPFLGDASTHEDASFLDEEFLGEEFIGMADLSPFSPAVEQYEREGDAVLLAVLRTQTAEHLPAPVSDAARESDAATAAAFDAEFDAIIADFERCGLPDDPMPPDAELRDSRQDVPPRDPIGVRIDDERTMDQLRADLLCDLLLTGAPTGVPGSDDDDASTGSASSALGAIRATVQVTLRASTLVGADDLPAELDGSGPLDPDWARALAGTAPSLDRLFLDSRGMVTATDSYTPTSNMKRFLRARDQHCRFPGCRRPPQDCQIDHNDDHARGGPTALSNLALFCTGHHPIKHPDLFDEDRWTATQLPGGVIVWTSPLGRTYLDRPAPRVMFV